MKKSIALLIILTMVLGLALAGCDTPDVSDSSTTNQNTAASNDNSSDDFDTGDSTIMDGTNNPDGDKEEAPQEGNGDSNIDNKNPQQDADGMYVYNVQGHEIKLSFNIWDYINWIKLDGVQIDDAAFYIYTLAEDLGYTVEDPDYSQGYYGRYVDGYEVVRVGFNPQGGTDETYVSYRLREEDGSWAWYTNLLVSPYDLDVMTYYNVKTGGQYPINLDMIILCAYCMEYYSVNDTGDCWMEIFGETSPIISPYELQQ